MLKCNKKNRKGGYVSRVYANFEPIKELGRGAGGIVWSARSQNSASSEPRYAVKRTFPRDNSEGYADLRETEKELEALSQLRIGGGHPNVVEIYTAVIEKPPPNWVEDHDPLYHALLMGPDGKFNSELVDLDTSSNSSSTDGDVDKLRICPITIVQQLCNEGSLRNWLKGTKVGARDLDLILDFATQLADGLRFLHFRGIIHKDLKPGNIFLQKKSKRIILKLGDFGLSKFVDRPSQHQFRGEGAPSDHGYSSNDNALTRGFGGTPFYRSPEQVACKPYGFKVDIYALGLILVELFLPHPAESVQLGLKKFAEASASECPKLDIIPPPVLHLILEMMSTNPDQRPSAPKVHDTLLGIWRKNLKLPIQNFAENIKKHPHISGNQAHLLMNRPDLDRLLNLYLEGNNLVCLEGEAGSGKTTLALQFAQRISSQGGGESIIWIDTNYQAPIKNKLEWLGNLVRANVYRSSGHRATISELVLGIQDGFRNQKWIFIMDNFISDNTEHSTLLNLFKLEGPNKPFLVVCTRTVNYFQQILDGRDNYVGKDFSEDMFKMGRLMQTAWKNVPDDPNPPAIHLNNGYSSEKWIGLEFLCLTLKTPICEVHRSLGDYLDWNPLALRLASLTIMAHELLPSFGLIDSSYSLIYDMEEYISIFLQKCEEFEGKLKKVPAFHRYPEQITSNYTDLFPLRVVLHLTMCQIETALSGRGDLLATLNHIQLYLILFENEEEIPDMSTSEEVTTTAWSILVLYGLVREWTDEDGKLKHTHICGNHCLDFSTIESEEFDEEFDFSNKKRVGGFSRYGF